MIFYSIKNKKDFDPICFCDFWGDIIYPITLVQASL